MPRRSKSSYKQKSKHWAKPWLAKKAEKIYFIRNKIPVIRQVRTFKAKRHAFKRKIKGNLARLATLGYVKNLADKRLKPCKGLRKQLRKAYFGFKMAKNWKRGGNRTIRERKEKFAKSRFTVLNCK